MRNIIIFMEYDFNLECGGLVVQYQLAKHLINLGVNIKIRSPNNFQNSICNEFYDNSPIDLDNTIVIYGETIIGNPLNARYVIRWILAPLGIIADKNIYKTWGSNDLVYYFNSEKKFVDEPDKSGDVYKLLNIIYIHPLVKNNYMNERDGYCHTFRKTNFHKTLTYIHPSNSFEITRSHGQQQYIEYFNKYKYFISYDPLTFLNIIAALCGCISIVNKIEGVSKEEWLSRSACGEYFKQSTEKTYYGIAYGLEDIAFAEQTLPLVKQQWQNIITYMINKNLKNFIDDINNWENNKNTIKNNFVDKNFENQIVLYKGIYWPIKDVGPDITSDYANPDSTCYKLMHVFQDVPKEAVRFVKNHRVILQAGGNAGFYVKQYSNIFDYVYTFEPDPLSFYCLNRNVTTPNVFKFQACLGNNRECVSILNTSGTNVGHRHGGAYVNGSGLIPTLMIDDLGLEICDLIHLDIEGYEYKALLGGINTIKKCRPVIIIENYWLWLSRYGTSIQQIEDFLATLDYKLVDNIQGDNVYQPIEY